MMTGFEPGTSRRRRGIALAAALLLLLVQSFAAAHYHQDDPRQGLTHNTRVADADALCAVCAFHMHSPTNSSAATTALGPAIVEYRIAFRRAGELIPAFVERAASRAPPLSA
jgi:hypothetical protein